MSSTPRPAPAEELLEHGDGLIELDPDWVIVRVNAAQERTTGKPRSETVGRVFWEVWPEVADPEGAQWRAYHRCMQERVAVEFQDYFAPFDVWFHITAHPTSTGGIAVSFRDVTSHKRAEQSVRAERDFSTAILDTLATLVIVLDTDARIVRFNAACERATGYAEREVLGKSVFELLIPEVDLSGTQAAFRQLRLGDFPNQHRNRWRVRDGTERLLDWSNTAIPDEHGQIQFIIATGVDVTERVQAVETLRESEERYRSVFDSAAVGVGRVALNGHFLEVNEAYSRLLGYTRDELLGLNFQAVTHPDDLSSDVRQLGDLLAGRTRSYRMDKRYIRRNGSTIWVSLSVGLARDAAGEPAYCTVVVEDISARKAAEEALRENEQRLNAIFEDVAIGVLEVDEQDRLVGVNRRFCAMVGYSREELLGRTLHDLTAPEDREVTRELNAKAHVGELTQFEYAKRYVRRDGSRVWVEVNVRVVKDARGRFVRSIATTHDITDRRRAVLALRESEAKFRSVFEQAAIGMGRVRFSDARWIDVNDTFCRMLGRSRDEMLRTPWPALTHPEDVELDLTPFHRMAAGELDSYTVEKRFLHADGHHVWVKLTLSVVRDAEERPVYEVAIIEDIGDRKRVQQELLESEERHRTVLENMAEGLVLFDPTGNITYQNPASLRIHTRQLSADRRRFEHLVSSWRIRRYPEGDVVPPEQWAIPRVLRGERIHNERFFVDCIDEPERSFVGIYSGAPVHDSGGRLAYGFLTIEEITDQARAETAVRDANEKLREEDRRKNEFLGMLSHELRNPLAPIRNALYLLERGQAEGQQARRAKDIVKRQVAHLTRLVDDLLDVTRIARGKIELRREGLDLGDLVRRTAEDYRPVLQSRGLLLTLDIPTDPILVNGDPARLTQVFGNLLNNAAKFTPTGGRVSLSLRPEGERAVAHVQDTGPGIAPDVLPTLFEPFTQGKQTLARAEGGLGLGLSLVKGLVALHGGDVSVSSVPGGGADFVVRLGLREPAAEVAAASRAAEPRATVAPRHRVLVVDDNHDAAESLGELMQLLGHEAELAFDGPSAIAEAGRMRPDLVLCDIGLPGMDGYQVARELRARYDGALRIVALSGYAQPEDVDRALEAGFDAHVAKPPDPERLAQLLE